ncbi:MAG: hypothetical protein IAG13_06315 [Deltaproteobacteria bacterium]|nr:hypothetical protein [Nannocystaceae bacterium]
MHPLYPHSWPTGWGPGIDPHAFDIWAWFNVVGMAGCICWVVAYVAMIRTAQRDHANALPMIAIALNFSWELLASFVFPNPVALWHAFDRIWLLVDVVIVVQLLRWGRPWQRIPEIRAHFYPVVAVVFTLGLVGQYTFVADYPDRLGLVIAFLINLVMSVMFVIMYLDRRPQLRGISRAGAWFKMLGTLGTSIECHWVVRMIDPELGGLGFLTFLCVSIFAFDCLYIWLVMRGPALGRLDSTAASAVP